MIAPTNTSQEKILQTVDKKSKWIIQKLFEIREMEYRKRSKEYVNGESFTYMGRNYSLQIVLDTNMKLPEPKLYRGKLTIYTHSKEQGILKKALENWYQDKAKEKIRERVEYYQTYFDIKPTKIIIKEQQKRWGCCTKRKRTSLQLEVHHGTIHSPRLYHSP